MRKYAVLSYVYQGTSGFERKEEYSFFTLLGAKKFAEKEYQFYDRPDTFMEIIVRKGDKVLFTYMR